MNRFAVFVGLTGLAVACSIPDVPVPDDGGADSSFFDAGADSATNNEGGRDASTGESGLDATFDASADASAGNDGASDAGHAGNDSGVEGGEGGTDAGADAAVCVNGSTRCLFNGVQTCVAGVWPSAVPCPASAPQCIGGMCGQPPSCQASVDGTANCGAGGGGSESCCTSPEVPGGSYDRTYKFGADGGPTGEADPASVSGFRLDKYLVTVGRFRQFVRVALLSDGGAGFTPAAATGKHVHLNDGNGLTATDGGYEPGWVSTDDTNIAPTDLNLACQAPSSTWTNAVATPSQETLPINCVNWYEAYAFCISDGGFLPSEAEWEYAAAGGSAQLEYPWGSTAPGTANQYAIYNSDYTANPTNIAPVGTASLGAGVWGQLDMAGDLFEWNLDWLDDPYVDPCTDCASLSPTAIGPYRVFRGGDFPGPAADLVPSFRLSDPPAGRTVYVGFRCARTP